MHLKLFHALAIFVMALYFSVQVEGTAIKFGQSAAFTGVSSQLGLNMREGILAAFKEVNDLGGIKGNITFDLISYDDGYEPTNTTTNTNKLLTEDDVFALIGYVGTPTSLAALAARNSINRQIPFIAPFTGSKSLRLPVDQTIINTRSSYVDETAAMVNYLVNKRFISRISIMYQNDSFGAAGYDGLTAAMSAVGLKLESEGTYPRNTEDVQGAYDNIFSKDPQAIVLVGTYAPLAKFVSLAKMKNSSLVFLSISFVGAEAFVTELQARSVALDEIYITEVLPLYSETAPYLVKEYTNALTAYNAASVPSLNSFEGYIAGRLAIELVRQSYPEVTREAFLDVVYTSQYFTLSGLLLGPYSESCTQGMRSIWLLNVDNTGLLAPVPNTRFEWSTCFSSDGTSISPIVFGQSAPLEGTVRELGIGMSLGIRASFAARNRFGGIRNRKLVLISRDDKYEPKAAVANTEYLIREQNVFAIVGPVGTPTTQAILPVIEEQKTPLVGPFTGAKIFRRPCSRNIVNVRASYIDEVAAMTRHFIDNLGLQRISIFYQDDAFGLAGLEGLDLALNNRSMSIESRGTYERNTFDLLPGLASIQEGDPQVIVMIGTYKQLAQFAQLATSWRPELYFGTVSFVDSEAFANELRVNAVTNENIFVTQVVPDPLDASNQLVSLYQNALLDYDPNASFGFVSLEGYVVGEFLIKVLDSIDSTLDITRESFLDTVFSQAIFRVAGLAIGPFSGSSENCTCNQGLHRVVTTRVFPTLNYTIAEVHENDFRFETCGVNYPEPFVPVSVGVRAGIIVAACACAALAVVFIILTLVYRASKTVKHSSLVFSLLTLVGAALMLFSPVFIVLEVPQCMLWMWLLGIGFILFFGSMAVKSYRIDRIFNWHRKKLTKIKPIGDNQLMVVVSILLGLEIILLVLWQVLGEIRAVEFEGISDSIFGCASAESAFPFIITQIVYFGVVFLVGCFFAFRTRNVNIGSYKETKEIFFAVYNMTLLFIIIIPLVALVGVNDTETAAIITSIGLLFSVMVSVLCLFVLKFYRIINKREKLSQSSNSGTSGIPTTNAKGSSAMSNNNNSTNKSTKSSHNTSKRNEESSSSETDSNKKAATSGNEMIIISKSTDALLPALNQSSNVIETTATPANDESSDSTE